MIFVKVVIQRVKEARVEVNGKIVGQIQQGLLLLVGIEKGDREEDVVKVANKIVKMRIFEDSYGKMNLSIQDIQGKILSVSQFTLAANVAKGNRPSFDSAEQPSLAQPLFDRFNHEIRQMGIEVSTGVFAAMMDVILVNDGPVTFII